VKIVKYDQYLRAVYDKVSPPPPNHFRGADQITILEDGDGDGTFERHKVFLGGLNMARSVIVGRGGVWVLMPPYLLFYPDRNRDDIPDGDPEVHLAGFGLEDTHSGANSLRWGPDGWLYGAHGSTCTADVKGVKFLGQAIWRYHPATKEFEVFAEGGGNTYCIDFDAQGRLFSGSNYSDTRGVHYEQGGAYIKGWGKHGPLMNPHSYGWFEHMAHNGFKPRFAQSMILYEGGLIPSLEGQIVAAMSLVNRVQASRLYPDTSTFRTEDGEPLLLTDDRWFRPVDTKAGPDGAIYLADWYDSRLSHMDPRDTWHKESGRIYRMQAKGARPVKPFDLSKLATGDLIHQLKSPNKWTRQEAQRLIADRHDAAALPPLRALLKHESGQLALEALWALHTSGGFDDALAIETLRHANPSVRSWTIRLLGDSKKLSPALQPRLVELARTEPDLHVRTQLAASCKRWPTPAALPIVRELCLRSEDAADKHQPLLIWWALESKAAGSRTELLSLFKEPAFWDTPLVARHLIARLGQRYTAERTSENLDAAAMLLALAPSPGHLDRLIAGMSEGLRGDALQAPPAALKTRVAALWETLPHSSALISVSLRLGHAPAAIAAAQRIADPKTAATERAQLLALVAERREAAALPLLLELLRTERAEPLRAELLHALQRFDDPRVARTLLELHAEFSGRLRAAAQAILASRSAWARLLLESVDKGQLKKEQIVTASLLAIAGLRDPQCDGWIQKHWGRLTRSSLEKEAQIAKSRALLASGKGDPKAGRELFTLLCASCHTLNGQGVKIGPDLTGYERDNLDFILPAIADPSLAIREEYVGFNITTRDGQNLSGLLIEQSPRSVTLLDLAGQRSVLPRDEIQKLEASPISLMPEGLLETLTEQQLRDLFAYLQAGAKGK
jgi:putative membrane-bound dehydrogenase-like protein